MEKLVEYKIQKPFKVGNEEVGFTHCPKCGETVAVHTRNNDKPLTSVCKPWFCNTLFDPSVLHSSSDTRYWALLRDPQPPKSKSVKRVNPEESIDDAS